MEYTFQKVQLTQHEKLWLNEVYESQEFDVKKTKVKLHGKIPNNFDVSRIDNRLYRYDHLTLVGIWHIALDKKIIGEVAQVIAKIKEMILTSPGIRQVMAADIAQKTGLQDMDVEVALRLMADLGKFTGNVSYGNGNKGYSSIEFPSGDDGYDAYLAYENINDLVEEFYTRKSPERAGGVLANWLSPNVFSGTTRSDAVKKLNTAFVIMPIDPEDALMVDVYSGIKEVCEKFGIQAVRADDIEHQESITEIVLEQIRECEFLIADLSHERPNVYYEIGYAHAINKHPILYRSQGTKLHFDLYVHNVPEYKNATELKLKLERRFEEILGRKAK